MEKDNHNKWIVPKDYVIHYDQDKNYNEINCSFPEYLPPYRSDFSSVYQGVEIEMHIVDHCNLNCNCCNHFSPLAKPNFVSLESFQQQLSELVENIPNIKTFLILGGEPTLHPQLFEICMSARKILGPKVYIDVLSNGTNINKISKYKDEYLKADICFTFSSYYQATKIEEIKKLAPLGRIYNTRILSKQTLVEPYGDLDSHYNFFNCVNHKLPCFTLKDHKLFICPFSAHINIYCAHTKENIPLIKNKDYLMVSDIKNNMDLIQTFCFTPKPICSYCKPGPSIPYSDSLKDRIEFELTIRELYFRDYPRYEKIINAGTNGLINWATNYDLNPGRVDTVYEPHNFETEILRYKTGKIDIIIPYYNELAPQLVQLRDNLLTQTIIKDCVIYLISDQSFMDPSVLKIFDGYKDLHCVFLRNVKQTGPGGARNKGIVNSYAPYLLCLDADNSFIKTTALEEIYNQVLKYDLICWESYDKWNKSQQNFCVKREALNKNNLLYKNIYFGEDSEFYIRLINAIPNQYIYNYNNKENIFTAYNTTSSNNITSVFIHYDKLHFSLFTALFIGLMEIKNTDNENYLIMESAVLQHINSLIQEHNFLISNTFIKSLLWYELYMLQIKNSAIVHNNNFQSICKILNLDFTENKDIIKNFLSKYIRENYLNQEKFHTCAQIILSYIKEDI